MGPCGPYEPANRVANMSSESKTNCEELNLVTARLLILPKDSQQGHNQRLTGVTKWVSHAFSKRLWDLEESHQDQRHEPEFRFAMGIGPRQCRGAK
eukprot:1356853-Amphidinium_carterae.1